MIRFEGVSKIYSTDVVLKNINWEIKKSLLSSFGNFDQITPGEKNLATSSDIFSANGSDE